MNSTQQLDVFFPSVNRELDAAGLHYIPSISIVLYQAVSLPTLLKNKGNCIQTAFQISRSNSDIFILR